MSESVATHTPVTEVQSKEFSEVLVLSVLYSVSQYLTSDEKRYIRFGQPTFYFVGRLFHRGGWFH
jgi:hypothetical protein